MSDTTPKPAHVGFAWLPRLQPPGRTLCILLVVALPPLLSRNLTNRPFTGPDMPTILANLSAAGPRDVAGWLVGDWVQQNGYYRPLVSLSLWVDFHLFGPDRPLGWRVHSALLLAALAVLIALVAREPAGSDVAALAAGLWAATRPWNQLILEAVAPRTDLLCGVFYVAAVLATLRWARGGGRRWLGGALACTALALGCKELAVTLLAILPLAAWSSGAGRWRTLKLAGGLAAGMAVYWLFRCAVLGQSPVAPRMLGHRFPLASQLEPYLVLLYPPLGARWFLGSLTWPQLALPRTWAVFAGVVAHTAALPLVWRLDRRRFGFALGWMAISYLPALPYRLLGMHYYLVPQLGNALLLGWGAEALAAWWRRRRP
ncbi:MAG: glycosyltransferase family 39 protein [Armatimonadetes bacterium]|nr:glycosyltransferase family 39 protein [Armatimonadota bacterium]